MITALTVSKYSDALIHVTVENCSYWKCIYRAVQFFFEFCCLIFYVDFFTFYARLWIRNTAKLRMSLWGANCIIYNRTWLCWINNKSFEELRWMSCSDVQGNHYGEMFCSVLSTCLWNESIEQQHFNNYLFLITDNGNFIF